MLPLLQQIETRSRLGIGTDTDSDIDTDDNTDDNDGDDDIICSFFRPDEHASSK